MTANRSAESIKHSADYKYIEFALEGLWDSYVSIIDEMDAFKPRPLCDFDCEREKMIENYAKFNQDMPEKKFFRFIDEQIQCLSSERFQFRDKFLKRFSALYVSVTLLSHALCEAVINAILAIGLCRVKQGDVFSIIEKADIKSKWKTGPKCFCLDYSIDCNQSLWETLIKITKERNGLIHYKINLEIGGEKALSGSKIEHTEINEQRLWVPRYFSLPYDLDDMATSQLEMMPILFGSSVIQRAKVHGVTPHFSKFTKIQISHADPE